MLQRPRFMRDRPDTVTPTPSATPVAHTAIPVSIREAHFPYSEPQFLNWLSDVPASEEEEEEGRRCAHMLDRLDAFL